MLGVAVSVLGTASAVLAAALLDRVAVSVLPEFPFKPDTFFLFPGWLLVGALGLGLIAALGGAWLPARRAAALDPARVLAG